MNRVHDCGLSCISYRAGNVFYDSSSSELELPSECRSYADLKYCRLLGMVLEVGSRKGCAAIPLNPKP